MSWYRKYRPAKVSDLAISSVKEIFESMLNSGKIPQVMLFAGPRGTGKTSSARIIAGILNDPQNQESIDYLFFGKEKPKKLKLNEPDLELDLVKRIYSGSSFVVQEMDAASNRGIDDVRALKERLSLPPQDGKMSVYILDEAHMLTKEAFNALLKMLEETPPHVAFILATTELHKIPATVASRCTTINFRKAEAEEILLVLKKISKAEELEVENGVFELITQSADGSFRDAIKLLELLGTSSKKISLELASERLSAVGNSSVEELLAALLEKDEKKLISLFTNLRERQVDEKFLFKSLLEYLHEQLLLDIGVGKKAGKLNSKICLFLLKELSSLELANNLPVPLLSLEIKFLELIFRSKEKSGGQAPSEKKSLISKKSQNLSSPDEERTPGDIAREVRQEAKPEPELNLSSSDFESDSLKPVSKGDGQKLLSAWGNFLGAVEKKQAAIAMLLRSSKPLSAQNGSISVEVYYPFHKEKLEDMTTLNLLKDCTPAFAGGLVDLEFILSDRSSPEMERTSGDAKKQSQIGEVKESEAENILLELAEEVLV